jgi:hypothetical protein
MVSDSSEMKFILSFYPFSQARHLILAFVVAYRKLCKIMYFPSDPLRCRVGSLTAIVGKAMWSVQSRDHVLLYCDSRACYGQVCREFLVD